MPRSPVLSLDPRVVPADPLAVAGAWPAQSPLVMVHSGRRHQRWSRWSILAAPTATYRYADGASQLLGDPPPEMRAVTLTHDPLIDLDRLLSVSRIDSDPEDRPVPFRGGWIGLFGYELGRLIEPSAVLGPGGAAAVPPGADDDRQWPLIELAYCPHAMVFDNATGRWCTVGDPWPDALADHTWSPPLPPASLPAVVLDDLASSLPGPEYRSAVERAIEYIRAGDIFQANITQRVSIPFDGRARDLARHALRRSSAWYGAYLELQDDRAVVSMSPELFLQLDPHSRTVVTRPIKGTTPSHVPAHRLLESAKDAAELHMIIDLLRNDLGRVCEYGSVQVRGEREIETHPTVHHGVAEVQGRLRPGVTIGQLIGATFPGGSVTGAPKIRAMQIIDELEPVQRGPYCGAIGWISRCGRMTLNIAIRTLMYTGPGATGATRGVLDYGAGGGIVADSDPELEYQESWAKAAILRRVFAP